MHIIGLFAMVLEAERKKATWLETLPNVAYTEHFQDSNRAILSGVWSGASVVTGMDVEAN